MKKNSLGILSVGLTDFSYAQGIWRLGFLYSTFPQDSLYKQYDSLLSLKLWQGSWRKYGYTNWPWLPPMLSKMTSAASSVCEYCSNDWVTVSQLFSWCLNEGEYDFVCILEATFSYSRLAGSIILQQLLHHTTTTLYYNKTISNLFQGIICLLPVHQQTHYSQRQSTGVLCYSCIEVHRSGLDNLSKWRAGQISLLR